MRFLAAIMLHVILGEGDQPPVEPRNYQATEIRIRPAGSHETLRIGMEVIKPGGKSSHELRSLQAGEIEHLRAERAATRDELEGRARSDHDEIVELTGEVARLQAEVERLRSLDSLGGVVTTMREITADDDPEDDRRMQRVDGLLPDDVHEQRDRTSGRAGTEAG